MSDPITSMDEAEAYAAKLPKMSMAGAPSPADICAAWGAAKPIATFLLGLPFVPARVRAPVQYVMTLLDAFCSI